MIELSHIYKTYPGPVHALRDVNLKIEKGEFVFLTGPSGAGKTTLFKLISAYSEATSGQMTVAHYNLNDINKKEIPYLRRKIGVVYQDFKLLNHRTVFDNVALPLEVQGESQKYIQKRVREVLEDVGLTFKKDKLPLQLSGGSNNEFLLQERWFITQEFLLLMSPLEI